MGFAQRNSRAANRWAQERNDKIKRAQSIRADRALQHKKRYHQGLNSPDDTSAQEDTAGVQPLSSTENFLTDHHCAAGSSPNLADSGTGQHLYLEEENLKPKDVTEEANEQDVIQSENQYEHCISSCALQLNPSSSNCDVAFDEQSENRVIRHGRRRKLCSQDDAETKTRLNEEQENAHSSPSCGPRPQVVASNMSCIPHPSRENNQTAMLKINSSRPSLIPQLYGSERSMHWPNNAVDKRCEAIPEGSLRCPNKSFHNQRHQFEKIEIVNVQDAAGIRPLEFEKGADSIFKPKEEDSEDHGGGSLSAFSGQNPLSASTEEQSTHRQTHLEHLKQRCSARRFGPQIESECSPEQESLMWPDKQLSRTDGTIGRSSSGRFSRKSGSLTGNLDYSDSQSVSLSRGLAPEISEGPKFIRKLLSRRFSVHPAIRNENTLALTADQMQTATSDVVSKERTAYNNSERINNHQGKQTVQSADFSNRYRRLRRALSENSAKFNADRANTKDSSLNCKTPAANSSKAFQSTPLAQSGPIADLGPMKPCPSCGRTFLESSLATHTRVCMKIFKSRRKVYNSSKARMRDMSTDQHLFSKTSSKLKQGHGTVRTKWRQQSQQLRESLGLGQGSKSTL